MKKKKKNEEKKEKLQGKNWLKFVYDGIQLVMDFERKDTILISEFIKKPVDAYRRIIAVRFNDQYGFFSVMREYLHFTES